MYSIEYQPIAMQDMVEIVRYISQELCNTSAAEKLANDMIEAAESLVVFPYSKAVHFTQKPLKHEYRRLVVKNYAMFYWINEAEKRVVITRVVYARRNFDKLLD